MDKFRTQALRAKPGDVIRDEKHAKGMGVIYGIKTMSKGFVKDSRGWEIDDNTLDQLVSASKRVKQGLKCRFGHPNMSGTALGSYVGRLKNHRLSDDGNHSIADLFIDHTAYSTPQGDLATYVMDLAENDADAFGTSVVLSEFTTEYRRNEDGTTVKDKDGSTLPPLLRIKKLFACDCVDDPAANNGLFSTGSQFFSESVQLSAEMTEKLDMLLSSPQAVESVISFLDHYRINRDEAFEENPPQSPFAKGEEEGGVKPPLREENETSDESTESKEESMELSELTKEALSAERGDLVAEIKEEEKQLGVTEERERVQGILAKATELELSQDAANEQIESGASLSDATNALQAAKLAALQEEAPETPGDNGDDNGEEKTHMQLATEYRDANGGSMTDALRATAKK